MSTLTDFRADQQGSVDPSALRPPGSDLLDARQSRPDHASTTVSLASRDLSGNGSLAAAISLTDSIGDPQLLFDPFLALAGDVLDDLEANRIANENRLRQLTRTETDVDGGLRGFGLTPDHPDVQRLAALVDLLKTAEHQADLNLRRLMRRHPLGPWVKQQHGVGDRQAARLLAVVGDPYLNATTGQPRTVSQLWAYCGHGDPARRRRKGMTQAELFTLGNPTAKKRVWLIAEKIIVCRGSMAETYYARKAQAADRTHAADCVRCGPAGHPALRGTAWSDAHRHADALRVLGKEFLKQLWLEARRLHGDESAVSA